jgi:hypothetical protein
MRRRLREMANGPAGKTCMMASKADSKAAGQRKGGL